MNNPVLKTWSAKFQGWIDSVESRGKFQIERAFVFRRDILPIRLLAHLDLMGRIAARLQKSDLGRCILWVVIENCHRHQYRQIVSQAAAKYEVKARLLGI